MIYVSAGHHATAVGACAGDICEYPNTAKWADEVVTRWRMRGYEPDIVRVPDGTLREKVKTINNDSAVLALEIHFNASQSGRGHGSETLYFPGSAIGKRCAEVMQEELTVSFGPDRGVKEGWYRLNPKNGPNYFLRRTLCPALIVEPAFIYDTDQVIEQRPEGCEALVNGLRRCLDEVLAGTLADRLKVRRDG